MAKSIARVVTKTAFGKVLGLETKDSRLKAQRVGAAEVKAEQEKAAEIAKKTEADKAAASTQAAEQTESAQAESRRQALSGLLLTGEGEEPSRRRFLKGAK